MTEKLHIAQVYISYKLYLGYFVREKNKCWDVSTIKGNIDHEDAAWECFFLRLIWNGKCLCAMIYQKALEGWFCTAYKNTLAFIQKVYAATLLFSSSEDFAIITCLSIIFILMFTRWDFEASMYVYHIFNCVFIHVLHCWTEQTRVHGQHCEVKGKKTPSKSKYIN